MAKYIDADALIEDITAAEENGGMGAVVASTLKRYVARMPAADVEPCKYDGEYIRKDDAIEATRHAWAKGLEPSQYIEILPTADVEPVRKWIPCSERLPEDGEKVLVYWERIDRKTNTVYGFIDILYRTSERGWYCEGRGELNWKAVAWMPLPEPPKMDGGSEE